MRVAPHITLDDKERKILQRWSRGSKHTGPSGFAGQDRVAGGEGQSE